MSDLRKKQNVFARIFVWLQYGCGVKKQSSKPDNEQNGEALCTVFCKQRGIKCKRKHSDARNPFLPVSSSQ